MRKQFYRYFLGFRPPPALRYDLARLAAAAGQRFQPELSHLTLCVIEEADQRDLFLYRRVDAALADQALSSIPIRLGRVCAGDYGALVRTIGRQPDIQHFYRMLVRRLAGRGVIPLHRKSGLYPHVTLGYERCEFDPFDIALEWVPEELLLIESHVGNSHHHVVGRWPLLPSAQGALAFVAPPRVDRAASSGGQLER